MSDSDEYEVAFEDQSPEQREPPQNVAVVVEFDWETLERIEVESFQYDFVSPVPLYRKLCDDPDKPWKANAIECSGRVVGFVMTAVERETSTYWIGGLMVDRTEQNRGIARRAIESLIERAKLEGLKRVAVSCAPDNLVANRLYARHGFVPTGPTEGIELVLERDV